LYFKTNTFPFSIHAEINTINKFYKKNNTKLIKNKKTLYVFKISKTGILGNSLCCKNCINFINNNITNLNLNDVYYSYQHNLKKIELDNINKDLNDNKFKYSSGITKKELY
jgi:hypothetical protein